MFPSTAKINFFNEIFKIDLSEGIRINIYNALRNYAGLLKWHQ